MMTEKQQQWANYVHDLTTERIEKYNKNPNLCKQCGVSLPYDGRKNKFCSHRCSALFNNPRRDKIDRGVFKCLNCGTESPYKWTHSRGKFCSNKCHAGYKQKKIKEYIESGESIKYQSQIRKYLLDSVGNKCQECGLLNVWNLKPITMQVHHIDGNSDNNKLDNVKLMCPNCHSQTDTWGSNNHRTNQNKRRRRYLLAKNIRKI